MPPLQQLRQVPAGDKCSENRLWLQSKLASIFWVWSTVAVSEPAVQFFELFCPVLSLAYHFLAHVRLTARNLTAITVAVVLRGALEYGWWRRLAQPLTRRSPLGTLKTPSATAALACSTTTLCAVGNTQNAQFGRSLVTKFSVTSLCKELMKYSKGE